MTRLNFFLMCITLLCACTHVPTKPPIEEGSNIPNGLAGYWLTERSYGTATAWTRLSFSNDMRLITQVWGREYLIGSFEEKISNIRPNADGSEYTFTSEVTKITPHISSYIDHIPIGRTRDCKVTIASDHKVQTLDRNCQLQMENAVPVRFNRE